MEAGRRLEQEARRRLERTQEAGKREEGRRQEAVEGGGWRAGRSHAGWRSVRAESPEGRRRVEIGGWSRGAGARRRWRVEGRAERRKPRGEREGGGRRLEAGAQVGAQAGAQAGD